MTEFLCPVQKPRKFSSTLWAGFLQLKVIEIEIKMQMLIILSLLHREYLGPQPNEATFLNFCLGREGQLDKLSDAKTPENF